jgi:hypothetical protein
MQMEDYSIQLGVLRYWNRVAIFAFLLALTIAYLVALVTEDAFFDGILPMVVAISSFALFCFAYLRIRQFLCPRCIGNFTIKHAFARNTNRRSCVHCGLPAYPSRTAE